MFFSKRAFFSTLGLALVVSVSGWFVVKSVQQQINQGKLPNDFVVNTAQNLRDVKTDINGDLTYIAEVEKAVRYENTDAWLNKMNIVFYNNKVQSKAPWHITSDYAKLTNNNNNIRLYDNVIMWRQSSGKNAPAVKIATQEALYDDEQDRLSSDRFITITQPGTKNITTGTGLIGQPKQGDYKLLKNVRSYYAGQHK